MNITPDSVARAKAALDQDAPEPDRSPAYTGWLLRMPPGSCHVSELEAWRDEGRAQGWVSPWAKDGLFARKGLGYIAYFDPGDVTLAFDHVHRHTSGDLTGELVILSDNPQAPDGGHLLQGTMNVSALGTRATIARIVAERAPALKIDWRSYLERFARYILDSERTGQETVVVGNQPRRPMIPYLLAPLLVKGKATILFGPEGTGKSFLAAGAAASCSSGETVIPGWVPPGRCSVLVLDWEDDEDEWNDRLLRIAAGCGIPPVQLIYRYGRGPLADDVEEVARIVAEREVGLVIVDSVSKAAPAGREGGDPSDSAGRLFAALRHIGGASLLLDHVPKASDKRGAERPYGSVMKPAWARITFELSRMDEEDDPDVGHLVLTNRKRNSGARTLPIGLRIEYSETAVAFYSEPVRGSRQSNRDLIDEVLLASREPLTYVQIAAETGLEVENLRTTMRRSGDHYVKLTGPDGITRHAVAVREAAA